MPLEVFDDLRLALIIKSEKTLFLSMKSIYFLITKDIFEKIIAHFIKSLKDLKIDTAFKIV